MSAYPDGFADWPLDQRNAYFAQKAEAHRKKLNGDGGRDDAPEITQETIAKAIDKAAAPPRACCFCIESGRWDSRIGGILIQPVGWAEASRDAEAILSGFA